MDFSVEQWINGPAGGVPLWDGLMKLVAGLAEPAFIVLVGAWFLVGWLRRRPRDRHGAIAALLAALAALVVNQVIALFWQRPRPFVIHPGNVHLLLSHSTDASFPSDHAAAAFAITTVLVVFHRRWGALALLGAALVAYARVYVGDHYPGDVAAGAVIGVLVALLLLTWLRPLPGLIVRVSDDLMGRLGLLKPG